MVRIEFDTDGSAFDPNTFTIEVERIVRDAADRIGQGAMIGPLLDHNGNHVGYFEVLPTKRLPT